MLSSDLYLWLAYSRVSAAKINKILKAVPIERLWNSFDEGGTINLDDKTFSLLKRTRSAEFIARTKRYLADNHIEYVTFADPAYPKALRQSEVNPPPVLFYKGDINILQNPCIAVVGTRRCSYYGKYATNYLADELARGGFTVVSGLATGIDGYAHRAALDAGGNTVAVLGSGLFNVTPVSNLTLFDNICKTGLVLSEYTPDTHASEYTFPQRNRIISGLCKGVIVVEAAERSGALITADFALEQGRDVFAVPGDIDKPRSKGTNNLIKQGAIAITQAKDVFDFYEMEKGGDVTPRATELDVFQLAVFDVLKAGETTFDGLVEKCKLKPSEINTALSSLILMGLVHEKSKNLYTV